MADKQHKTAMNIPSTATRSDASTGPAVYAGLKKRILDHEFHMGDALREEDVADWFGVSRAPARDALRRLEQEGLVERGGRRYIIRRYSYDEVVLTYRQRAALEYMAVEYAIAAGRDALGPVAAILEEQRQAVSGASRGAFSQLDARFHLAVAELGGVAMLVRELELVLDRVRLIRSDEIARDSGPKGAYNDHCRIFGALERGDARVAKAELNYHFATTVRLHRLNGYEAGAAIQDIR